MSQPTMELGHIGRRGLGQKGKDVSFSLSQPFLPQIIEVKADPVCRPVNRMNKTQWHQSEAVLGRAQSTTFERSH